MKNFEYALENDFDRASSFLDLPKERQLKIINWIHMYFVPTKFCNNKTMSSYGLKHVYERWVSKFEGKGEYLSNGELKGAMFAAGFFSNDYEVNTHCHFNISKNSLNLLHEVLNSEYKYMKVEE